MYLQSLMEILARANEENDYLQGAEFLKKLFDIFENISCNEHYINHFSPTAAQRQTRAIISDEQKINNENYAICERCNSFIVKNQLKRHQKTQKCRKIIISKATSSNIGNTIVKDPSHEINQFIKHKIGDIMIARKEEMLQGHSPYPEYYYYYNNRINFD